MAGGRCTLPAVMAREVPGPSAIPTWAVAVAEVAAADVVRRVRPTEASERRRAEVIGHARRLVGAALGCEVFAFGSVPLKTYLPDGDIDLTVLGNTSYGSTLIDDVYCILGSDEKNSDAKFEVKDLQRIDAEVRLIKCSIENIIVDISFNQTGGICALCFLEMVDCKVGKNNLFKRSIILIKAWCYYESRLLGAHHGLISTYALETLILYIFNLFHKDLHGPLEVLYRFLEYFSKFDWDNYCISLNGPVALSSMPNLIVETTNVCGDDLLFGKEFLESSVENASVPRRDSHARCSKFRVKHLNIIDPLKEYNNLGRSVNRANFNRIRTAFSYGARKLGQILMLKSARIPDEIYGFFKSTLERSGRGVRPDIGNDGAFFCQPFIGPDEAILEDMSSMKISYKKEDENGYHFPSKSLANNESNIKINVPTQGGCFPGDHKLVPSSDLSTKSSHCFHHAPKQYSYFHQENGNGVNEQYYLCHEMERHVSHCTTEALHLDDKSLMLPQVHANSSSHILNSTPGYALELPKPDNITLPHVERQHLPPFSLLSLPDLSGDLDAQLKCLRQVQYQLEYLFDEFLQCVQEASSDGLLSPSSTETDGRKSSPVSSSHSTEDASQQSQDEDHWGVPCQLNAFGTDVPSNGLSLSSYYADSESSLSWCHSSDGIPNMHGTGPYIPKKHMASLGERGKTLINQPVKIKSNQASVPKGSFVPYKEQASLDSGTKEITISQPLRSEDGLNGYTRSGRKTIEKQSGHIRKECIKPHNESRQIRRYYGDVCSSKNLFQKQSYGTDIEFARPASAMKQIPRHQPLEIQDTPNECAYADRNFTRKQSYGPRKGHQILDWPANQRPICKLQSRLGGRDCSKNLAAKQNYDNHSKPLSFVRDTEHIANDQAVYILNGSTKEVNPSKELIENGSKPSPLLPNVLTRDSRNSEWKLTASNACQPSFTVTKGNSQSGALETQPEGTIEFGSLGPFSLTFSSSKSTRAPNANTNSKACADASALVLQGYRAGATQSRSPGFYRTGDEDHFPGFYRTGDEDHFPPLHAGTR